MADPIIEELWAIKDGLARECGNDLRRLFDKLKEAQDSSRNPVVNRAKKRAKTEAGESQS